MSPILIYPVVFCLINIILVWIVNHDSHGIAGLFPIRVIATSGWLAAISILVLIGTGAICNPR